MPCIHGDGLEGEPVPIRNFRADDIDFALDLVHREGWQYDRVELQRMLDMDPEGSFVFEEEQPLGLITCVTYRTTGVIGHLVVSERARGRRIGGALIKQAIDYVTSKGMESLLLFATEGGVDVYKKHGFRILSEVTCIKADKVAGFRFEGYPGLSAIGEGDLAEISSIDSSHFGDDRSKLVQKLHRDHPDTCFKLERAEGIEGYAFGRSTSAANDLGPWFCSSGADADAKALFDVVLSRLDDRSVYMGVFSQNKRAVKAASSVSPVRTWRTQLMVRGEARYVAAKDDFLGLVGFELG